MGKIKDSIKQGFNDFWHGTPEDHEIERGRRQQAAEKKNASVRRRGGVEVSHQGRDPETRGVVEADMPDYFKTDPNVIVKKTGEANTYADGQDMAEEHGVEMSWQDFAHQNSGLGEQVLAEILDRVVGGQSYHGNIGGAQMSVSPMREDASMGAVGAGNMGSGPAMGRKTTTKGSIFVGGQPMAEKKADHYAKKWGKAMQKGDMQKAGKLKNQFIKQADKEEGVGLAEFAQPKGQPMRPLDQAIHKTRSVIGDAVVKAKQGVGPSDDKAAMGQGDGSMNKMGKPGGPAFGIEAPEEQPDDKFGEVFGKLAWGALGVDAKVQSPGCFQFISKTMKPIDDRLIDRLSGVAHHLDYKVNVSNDGRTVNVTDMAAQQTPDQDPMSPENQEPGMQDNEPAMPKPGAAPSKAPMGEERVGPHARREKAAMRSSTTPNKKMQQFVGECARILEHLDDPMQMLAHNLANRIMKRFGGTLGDGGTWRWSDRNYAYPIVMYPDMGGAVTLIISAFQDGTYTYAWFTGHHGLDTSETDRPEGISGQQLYGKGRGGTEVMLKDIQENLAEFARRFSQHDEDMAESISVGDFVRWTQKGTLYEGEVTKVFGAQAVVRLGQPGLKELFGESKVPVSVRTLLEAREPKNYHAVFIKDKDKPDAKWGHHTNADNYEDAQDEVRSQKRQNYDTARIVVPKEEANWHEKGANGIHDFVEKHLARKKRS